ncbi:MAG: ergothioneine biosynthesis protein EgtB [Leptolyngbyaceae cyanobacterium SM2_5_2]|nr:ergothioneine biosynthesis protein EgtB [Leptolyngbyaceae cyanobacterium SM2_5_2]
MLAESLTEDEYYRQAHPDFSPVGWHLGHIAFTESLWILRHLAGEDCLLVPYHQLFAADGLPKAARQQLPSLAQVLEMLHRVRARVEKYLAIAPLDQQLRLWLWLLQHESQHGETMAIVLALHCQGTMDRPESAVHSTEDDSRPSEVDQNSPHTKQPIYLPPATISLGYDGLDSLDNEQPAHQVLVSGFWLDPHPVTQADFRVFMEVGGYHESAYWSAQGWAWQQAAQVNQPRYWSDEPTWDNHPVCGVSYYEAEAYAAFVGKRLPSEAEWERAACWTTDGRYRGLYPWGDDWPQPPRGNFGGNGGGTTVVGRFASGQAGSELVDLIGNVWEWTASWFDGYAGFRAFPYRGYSKVYFDQQHRVLRGGSWASWPWALRGTLRNWYHPHVREIFSGFRCAQATDS